MRARNYRLGSSVVEHTGALGYLGRPCAPRSRAGRVVELADWVRKGRKRKGLTQAAFSKAVRVNVRTVRLWEAGEATPRDQAMARLEAFIGQPGDPGDDALPEGQWPQVLLADDAGVWRPSGGMGPLWTLLRVTMLKSVWVVRCAQRRQPEQHVFHRVAILQVFVQEIRSLVLRDWARVQGDVRVQAGVPLSWLRGRRPAMELAEFQQVWCGRGVIAVAGVDAEGRRRLDLRLRLSTVPGHYLEAVPPEGVG